VCIGQHLARLEMTRALNAIMDRLPNLRLDPDKPAPVVGGGVMRTPRSVFVRFG
jgi:cytochrome P450